MVQKTLQAKHNYVHFTGASTELTYSQLYPSIKVLSQATGTFNLDETKGEYS